LKDSLEHIFLKDIYSKPGPNYVEAPENLADMVHEIIKTYYKHLLVELDDCSLLKSTFCIEGNEISSRNFLFQTNSNKYIAKRIPQDGNYNKIMRLSMLHKSLSVDLPIPSIVCNQNDELFTKGHDGFYWIVLEFVEGIYYDGYLLQPLEVIAKAHCCLHGRLGRDSFDESLFDKICYSMGDEDELWRFALQHHNTLDRYFMPEFASMIIDYKEKIEHALHFTELFTLENQNDALCHHDWHLYNLLIMNDKVSAVLDLESISISCPNISIAFGSFKVLRQYMVCHKYDCADAAAAVKVYMQNAYTTQMDADEINRYVKIELLRRIFIILRLGFRHRDTAWAYNLPMHIRGLQEIDTISAMYK